MTGRYTFCEKTTLEADALAGRGVRGRTDEWEDDSKSRWVRGHWTVWVLGWELSRRRVWCRYADQDFAPRLWRWCTIFKKKKKSGRCSVFRMIPNMLSPEQYSSSAWWFVRRKRYGLYYTPADVVQLRTSQKAWKKCSTYDHTASPSSLMAQEPFEKSNTSLETYEYTAILKQNSNLSQLRDYWLVPRSDPVGPVF